MLWADLERVDSIAFFFLCQKLANLNAALGFGQNDQRRAKTSKSRKDTSVCRNVHISISASWFIGELECRHRRVGLLASLSVGDLVVGELVCQRVVQLPNKTAGHIIEREVRHIYTFASGKKIISSLED